jgi:hypothetical protein
MDADIPTELLAAKERICRQLGAIGLVLPGSIVDRWTRCGKTPCRCKDDPPQLHGPYPQWSRTVAGQNTTRLLSPEQVERYRPLVEEAKRLRELVRELEVLCVEQVEAPEGWGPPERRAREAENPAQRKAKRPSR